MIHQFFPPKLRNPPNLFVGDGQKSVKNKPGLEPVEFILNGRHGRIHIKSTNVGKLDIVCRLTQPLGLNHSSAGAKNVFHNIGMSSKTG